MSETLRNQEKLAEKGRLALRDTGPYSSRNTSKGALIEEAGRIFRALHAGLTIPEARERALEGSLLPQRSRISRERIWDALHHRYLAHRDVWVVHDLAQASAEDSHGREFLALLYLHYALRDHLTFDFITQVLWPRWSEGGRAVSRDDVLDLLDRAAEEQPQVRKWTKSSRVKLAGSILTAARDFGVLQGKQKKLLTRPPLPPGAAEHLLRILTAEGVRGQEVLHDATWRLFLLTETDVAAALADLARDRRIGFERAGRAVILHTPAAWRNGDE
jgi:hypothetical protein